MTQHEWITYARMHQKDLIHLIEHWHPAAATLGKRTMQRINAGMTITATNAEFAAEDVRREIAKKESGTDPVEQFKEALEKKNIVRMYSILNSTWFGVPESTSAWNLRGFSEAVRLLEEVPESD